MIRRAQGPDSGKSRKTISKTVDPLILKGWSSIMISRYETWANFFAKFHAWKRLRL